jgi:transcriptional regulator with XRE-family HTH domain
MSFGEVISKYRKEAGLSQKDLASLIKKEDGTPISPQYLNDLERDRRNSPPDYLLQQFAEVLGIPKDYLYFIAGELPSFLRNVKLNPEQVEAGFKAFRRTAMGE